MFNFSSFFGGGSSGGFGLSGMSSINFSDYNMIKSGSYKKLMKAYYAEQSGDSSKTSKSSSSSGKTSTQSVAEKIIAEKMRGTVVKDPTGLTQVQSQADALKTAAEAFGDPGAFQDEYGYYDTDKVVKSVNDFVNKYNSTLDQAGKVTSKDVAQEVGYMKSMTNTLSKELQKIGVTIGDDGKLTVNEDTLKNAHKSDVEAVFGGAGSYAAEIADKAVNIGSAAFRSSSFYSSNGSFYSSATSTYSSKA